MNDCSGVVLLDVTQVVIKIYELSSGEFRSTFDSIYAISSHDLGQFLEEAEIVEIIAQIFWEHMMVGTWKICARGVPIEIVKKVSAVTGYKIEDLILAREQELICKGMVLEE